MTTKEVTIIHTFNSKDNQAFFSNKYQSCSNSKKGK